MRRLWAAVCPVSPRRSPVVSPVVSPLLSLLLLLCVRGAPAHSTVPSPENVMVRCGDQRPTVSWDYSPQPPTNFSVKWRGSQSLSVQTEDLELDLSQFVWLSPETMFDYLYVNVTAEQGPRRSEPRQSPSFTYNRHKTTHVKCHLKFPPVNLSIDGAEATLSMDNPLYFYKELRTIQRSATFHLTITTTDAESPPRPCGGAERVCKFSVELPEDAEPCVNLTGTIDKGAEQILVLHNGPVCASAASNVELWLAAILSVVLLVCVSSLLAFGICKVRAWTFPKVPIPQALVPDSWSPRPAERFPEPVCSSVQITGTRPRTDLDPESPSPEPLQVQDEDQVLIQTEDYQDDSAESMKTETMSLRSSSSETELSNYERRGVLVHLNLSGDLVQGYTG